MDVGIETVVDDVIWEAARPVPEDVPWAVVPREAPGTAAVAWVGQAGVEPWAVTVTGAGAVTPELLAALGLATCGVGCPAGTSVALLSGRAMEISDSRRSSFSVSKELRRITG